MQDLLVEVGFEELPARFIDDAVQQLEETITKQLKQERLHFSDVKTYSTPRRLAVLIHDLSEEQPDLVEEIKGPPRQIAYDAEGNLTKAGTGFARSQGVSQDEIEIRQVQGGEYLFARKHVVGQETYTLLPTIILDAIRGLSFPKNMRWGSYESRFARPLRWIVALFGAKVIPVTIEAVQSDRYTYGHRQLSPGPIAIQSPRDYKEVLENNYVMPDSGERKQIIWEQIQALASKHGGKVQLDEGLLQEVTNLVEFPTAFCGSFQKDYLDVPSEVLITSMKEHQRYFPVVDSEDNLMPLFIGVRNGADNHLDNVIKGNEKVLTARLADAKFFYDEDCRTSLDENVEKLKWVVFQDGLGTMYQKVLRIERLSGLLAEKLGYTPKLDSISRTARLAKADLVSQMVYEFPELQGIMGEKYALLAGESEGVAKGIGEHYKPRFADDSLPTTVEGTVVGIADKLDTLVGYFALGRIPTGSQDPFALRRQAQGIVQMLVGGDYSISLREMISLAASGYEEVCLDIEHENALVQFFLARLRVFLLEKGHEYDIIDAVLASNDDRVPDLVKKVEELTKFRRTDDFTNLITAYERMSNLAAKSEQISLEPNKFSAADKAFSEAVAELEKNTLHHLEGKDYRRVLLNFAEFRKHVDSFFTDVMVMDQDPAVRQNRLSLLLKTVQLYQMYADFRVIVVNV
ncbi:MAG TPA: glycine--tRNA ligase subunit beta [Corynebacteriales bacterium]|jgi:glycyl-tRNA synthetase beta chain|nr:glycine--tRNA ligase subunit beta [Bacillota bacterium]HHY08798.1 glycine--tRNA ligase subunit beta [Mycobacteriales bacterium]